MTGEMLSANRVTQGGSSTLIDAAADGAPVRYTTQEDNHEQ